MLSEPCVVKNVCCLAAKFVTFRQSIFVLSSFKLLLFYEEAPVNSYDSPLVTDMQKSHWFLMQNVSQPQALVILVTFLSLSSLYPTVLK